MLIPKEVVIEIVEAQSPNVRWGYGLSVEEGAGRVQRWLFSAPSVEDLRKNMPPRGQWIWRVWQGTNVPNNREDFIEHVRETFTPGQHVYARANCKTMSALGSEGDFPEILEPKPQSMSSQNDVGTLRVDVEGSSVPTYAWTHWSAPTDSREAWVLPPGYQFPTAGIAVGPLEYEDFKKHMTEEVWASGSAVVLAAVGYYEDLDPFGQGPL